MSALYSGGTGTVCSFREKHNGADMIVNWMENLSQLHSVSDLNECVEVDREIIEVLFFH